MARTRAQRRRHTLLISLALALTLLVLLFGRDIARAAHGALSPRRSENRSFAKLANNLIGQENKFDFHLNYLLTHGQALSRPVFAARLDQLAEQLPLWSTQSAHLRRPVLAHHVNDVLSQLTEQRTDDYQSILATVARSLSVPWVSLSSASLGSAAAQAALVSTSHQWSSLRWSLEHEPGRVRLGPTTTTTATLDLASTLQSLATSATLRVTRAIGIAAVSVEPAPLPALPGELLLPPVSVLHLGVSVANTQYVDQPVSLTVSLVPIHHRGARQSQTMSVDVGPLRSFGFVARLLTIAPGERATLTVSLSGAPSAANMARTRVYHVVISPSGVG